MPLTAADLLRWEQAKDIDKFAQILCYLDDEAHREVWLYAVTALDHIHMVEAIPLLLQAADDFQGTDAAQKVKEVLVHWGQEIITPLLAIGLDPQKTESLRLAALDFLRSYHDPRILEAYLSALQTGERMSRYIIRWIWEMPDHEPLYAAVQSTDPQRRSSAVEALQGGADELRAWELTMAALEDECAQVRISAVFALSKMMYYWKNKDPENREDYPVPVADALIDKTRDEDNIVRRLVAQSLILIKDPRVKDAIQALLFDPDEDVRITAIRVYADNPNTEVCDRLKAIFLDTQDTMQIRSHVLETIARDMPNEATNFLIDVTRDEKNPYFRRTAIRGLGEVKSSQVLELLLACLDDQDPDIVSLALQSLDDWSDQTMVEPLLVHFDRTQDPNIITTYCHLFGGIKDHRTLIPMLRKVAGLEMKAVAQVVQSISRVLKPESIQVWLGKQEIGEDSLLAQGVEQIKQFLNAPPPTENDAFQDNINNLLQSIM